MIDLDLLEKQAIDTAINFRWEDAINLNLQILKEDKKNINAYLRLGFAHLQLNQLKLSKENYQKALKLQPSSQIAKQNLERLEVLEKGGRKKAKKQKISLDPNLFLEIPGKTKSVALVNLAQLFLGQEAFLKQKKRRVEIRAKNGDYIGCLPDDLSKRLILFLEAYSKYRTFVKEASLNRVTVFIQEVKKGKKVARFISFPFNLSAGIDRISASEKGQEPADEEKQTTEEAEITAHELEKMAENLTEEEKIYLPYEPEEEEEEEEE